MITIYAEKCNACGICEHVCPRHIPETVSAGSEKKMIISGERLRLCMTCGHCVALCPKRAIHVDGLDSERFRPVKDAGIDQKQLLTLMRQRRSIRRYGNEPVSREHLDHIIEAAGCAPTGTGSLSTGAMVITDTKILEKISQLTFAFYENLGKALKNPIARWVIRRKIGGPTLHTLLDFVMPGMRWYIKWYREGKSNEILRDAKTIILFTSPRLEPMGHENCVIAAFQAIFMAEVLGVGACFNDLIPQAGNRDGTIRKLLQLPDDQEMHTSITLGYPRYRFKRTVPRHFAEVRYFD